MPLTNAEKQARSRQRKAERVARYERALKEISEMTEPAFIAGDYEAGYASAIGIASDAAAKALSRD